MENGWRFRISVVVLSVVLPLMAEAAGPKPTAFSLTNGNVRLMGVRYVRSGCKPVVLLHGFMENSQIWKDVAQRLFFAGTGDPSRCFDVWMPNFRGHGRGAHRSSVLTSTGRYGFREILGEDVPLIIQRVKAVTGQKPIVVGHSMGAMSSYAYAAGVVAEPNGKLRLDLNAARRIAEEEIDRLILIAGPTDFKDLPIIFRGAGMAAKPIAGRVDFHLPTIGPERAPTDPASRNMIDRARRTAFALTDDVWPRLVPDSLINYHNLSRSEKALYREEAVSKLHTHLIDDFATFAAERSYIVDGIDLERVDQVFVKTLFIGGDQDGMAPLKSIIEKAKRMNPESEAKVIAMVGTSHEDTVFGKRAAELVTSAIEDFVHEPHRLGPAGQVTYVGKPGCSNLGKILRVILGKAKQ